MRINQRKMLHILSLNWREKNNDANIYRAYRFKIMKIEACPMASNKRLDRDHGVK
jgi:hypothetical protein